MLLAMCVAAIGGAVLGLVALPQQGAPVLIATTFHLVATVSGWWLSRWPAAWAATIAAASIGSLLVDGSIAWLTYQGATPWVQVAMAVGAFTLLRLGKAWLEIGVGSVALLAGATAIATVSIQSGTPIATAVLGASVPFLIGVIGAMAALLRHARLDRTLNHENQANARHPAFPKGSFGAAHRALATVMLRADSLAETADDAVTATAARDLREVARAGLDATVLRDDQSVITIELRRATKSRVAVPQKVASLTDREQEILRLVSTGATNAQIARSLYLSEATVKQYVSRLMRIFEFDNRTKLALHAAPWWDEDDA